MLENKINNYSYIDRLLSIYYNKSDNEVFEHYFNKFAKEVITTYLEQCKNKEKVIKFIKEVQMFLTMIVKRLSKI